ncbi:MAG: GPW/gp25 family protein [Planctomycetes bacterium]|nr:GPW/gp25 family protein [Planctomycetota bacterium]
MHLDFPYQFDARGLTAETEFEDHIRDLIHQVLFTTPGERVNRPDFGSGLLQLTFEPNSEELTGTVQFLVQGGLQQWLGDLIRVESMQVEGQEGTLSVTIEYVIQRTGRRQVAEFQPGGVGP